MQIFNFPTSMLHLGIDTYDNTATVIEDDSCGPAWWPYGKAYLSEDMYVHSRGSDVKLHAPLHVITSHQVSWCIPLLFVLYSMSMRLVESCEGMKAVDRKNGIGQSTTKVPRSCPWTMEVGTVALRRKPAIDHIVNFHTTRTPDTAWCRMWHLPPTSAHWHMHYTWWAQDLFLKLQLFGDTCIRTWSR